MVWIFLIICLIWGFASGLKKQEKNNEIYLNLGDSIIIENVVLYNNGANCYVDSSGTLIYGRNKGLGDCYWLAPTLNLTQQQFFEKLNFLLPNNSAGFNIRKISRKRTV